MRFHIYLFLGAALMSLGLWDVAFSRSLSLSQSYQTPPLLRSRSEAGESPDLPSALSPKDSQPFTRAHVFWKKRKSSDLLGTSGHGLLIDIDSRIPKASRWPSSQSRAYGGQAIQWSFSSGPSPGGSSCSPNTSVVISSLPECMIETNILSSMRNFQTGSLTHGVRAILVRKTKKGPASGTVST